MTARKTKVVEPQDGVYYLGDGADFGVEKEEVNVAFRFFGTEVRVNPEAGELSYVYFMNEAMKVDEDDETRGLPLVMDFLREQIHPDDWDGFFKLAKQKRQGMKDLMEISHAIIGSVADFPTTPPADSSRTQSGTGRKSKAVSSSPATRRRPAVGAGQRRRTQQAERALTLLDGRPDLQSAVVRAQEARSAS